jgi:hypothetical protein
MSDGSYCNIVVPHCVEVITMCDARVRVATLVALRDETGAEVSRCYMRELRKVSPGDLIANLFITWLTVNPPQV